MKNLKLLLIGSAILSTWACGGTATQNTATSNANTTNPPAAATPAATPDEIAMGRTIYEQNCAACHKEDGTGGKITIEGKSLNVDDLTSEKIKKFSDEKITGYIVNGVEDEGMPAFKDDLSDDEIKKVVRYVRTGIQKMPDPAKPAS